MPEQPLNNPQLQPPPVKQPEANPLLSEFATQYTIKEMMPTVAIGGFGNRAYEIPNYELERNPLTDFVLGVGNSVVDLAEGVADIIPMAMQAGGSDAEVWDNWINAVDDWGKGTRGRLSDAAMQPVSEGLNWNNFMGGLGQGVGFIGQMFLTGGTASAVGAGARGAKAAQFLTGTLNMTPGVYKEARAAGLDPQAASMFAISLSSLISMTEGAALEWMGKSMSKPLTNQFAKEAVKEALGQQAGKELTREAFEQSMALATKGFANRMKAAGSKALEPMLIESTQEFSQTYIEEGAKTLYDEMFAQDKEVGEGKFGANIGSAETFSNALFGALIGGVIGGGMSRLDTLKRGYQGETVFGFVNNSVKNSRPDNIEWLKQQAMQASIQGKTEIPAKETIAYIDQLARFSEQTKNLNITSSAANYQLFQLIDLQEKASSRLGGSAIKSNELHKSVAKAYKVSEAMAQMIGDQMNSEIEQIIDTKSPITSNRTDFEKRLNQYGFLFNSVVSGKISEPVLQQRLEAMKIKPKTEEQVQQEKEVIVKAQEQPSGNRVFNYKGVDVPEKLVMDAPALDTEFQQAKLNPDTNAKFIEEKSKEYGIEPAVLSTVIDNVPEVNQLYKEDKLIVVPPAELKQEEKTEEPGQQITQEEELAASSQAIVDSIVSNPDIKGVAGEIYVDAAKKATTPELQNELINTIYDQAQDNRPVMERALGKDIVEKIYKLKEKENAVQKRETKEVLQREPEEVGETGGERGRMESEQQGEETTEKSEEKAEQQEERVEVREAKEAEIKPAEESQERVQENRATVVDTEAPIDDFIKKKRDELVNQIRNEYRGLGEEEMNYLVGLAEAGQYDNLFTTGNIKEKDQRSIKLQNSQSIKTDPALFNKVLSHFKNIYPNIQVNVVRRLTNKYGVPTMARVTSNGIEVTEDAMQSSVIHEYAHVYLDLLGEKNVLVEEGLKEIRGTRYFTEAKLLYSELSENEQAMEALAEALAEKSLDKLREKIGNKPGAFARFMEWAKTFWKRIARMFKGVKNSEILDTLADSFIYQNQQINVDATYLDQKIKYQADKRTLDLIGKLQQFVTNGIDPYKGLADHYAREHAGELKPWEPRLFEGYTIENPTAEMIREFYKENLPQFHEFIENTISGPRIEPSEEISELLSDETISLITNVFKTDGTTWQGNTVANLAHEKAIYSTSAAELYSRIKESAEDDVPNVVAIGLASALESLPEAERNLVLEDLLKLKELEVIPVSMEYLDTKPTIDEVRERNEPDKYATDEIKRMFNRAPGVAKSTIKELKSLIPSLRINEEEVVDENGDFADNEKANALASVLAWANDPGADFNAKDFPALFDMFSDHYLMEKGLKAYGESRILNGSKRYFQGEETPRDFRLWLERFLHEARMVLGNQDVKDVMEGGYSKVDEDVFDEFQAEPTTKPAPEYTTDFHSVDGTFDTSGYHDQETDLSILSNEQAVKNIYSNLIRKGIVNPVNGWVNADGMADYFRKLKAELFRFDTIEVAGRKQYANWAALDHRMLNDTEEAIRKNAVSVRVGKEIMASVNPEIKAGLEELSPDQYWTLETLTKMQQRLHYVKGLKKGYFARENTQVAEEKILEDAKKALEYGAKKRKSNYDKIKWKPLRNALQWMEKNLLRWQMNSYMDIKLLTGSARNVVMKMFYDSLNQAESNRIKMIRDFDSNLQMEKLPENYKQWSAFNTKGISIDKVVGKSFGVIIERPMTGEEKENIKFSNSELMDIYMMLRQNEGTVNPADSLLEQGMYLEDEIKGRNTTDADLIKFESEDQLNEIKAYVEGNPEMMQMISKIDSAMDYMYGQVNNTYRQETGFTLPKINNYFPVYTKDDVIDITKRKASINEFRSARLRLGDNRPIRIGDINKVLVSHKISAALYASHALAITNNRKFLHELKRMVRPGTAEAQYVDSLDGTLNRIEDPKNLYSSVGEKDMDKLINKISSNFAVSVLAMNMPIIFKQPVGYFIMKGFIDPKYLKKAGFGLGPVVGGVTPAQFMKSLKYTGVKGGETLVPVEWKTNSDAQEYKEIIQYSARLAYRMEGAITRELGEAMSNAEAGQDRIVLPWKDKKTGEPVYISKSRLLEGIRVMDNNILMNTWKAVKFEAKEKYPQLKEGSPEYWDHVKNRTEFIISQTQPTYEMINRAELGASSNPVARFITMFTSASSKVGMNMVDRLVAYANNPSKENRVKMLRFVADNMIMAAATLAAIDGVKAMAYGADDDEIMEKLTTESIVNNLGYFYVMNIVANKVAAQIQDRPWAADTKHPVEMMVDDVSGFLANIAEGDLEKAIWNGLSGTAKATGLPLQGVILPKTFIGMMNEK